MGSDSMSWAKREKMVGLRGAKNSCRSAASCDGEAKAAAAVSARPAPAPATLPPLPAVAASCCSVAFMTAKIPVPRMHSSVWTAFNRAAPANKKRARARDSIHKYVSISVSATQVSSCAPISTNGKQGHDAFHPANVLGDTDTDRMLQFPFGWDRRGAKHHAIRHSLAWLVFRHYFPLKGCMCV